MLDVLLTIMRVHPDQMIQVGLNIVSIRTLVFFVAIALCSLSRLCALLLLLFDA